jgi:hypothetical protein
MSSFSKRPVVSSDSLPPPDLFNQPPPPDTNAKTVPNSNVSSLGNSISLPFAPPPGTFQSKVVLPFHTRTFQSQTLSVNTEPARGWSTSMSNISLPPALMSPVSVAPSKAGLGSTPAVATGAVASGASSSVPTATTSHSNPIFNVRCFPHALLIELTSLSNM